MPIHLEDATSTRRDQHLASQQIPAPRQPGSDDQPEPVLFLSGWQAHLHYALAAAKATAAVHGQPTTIPVVETGLSGLRSRLSARYRVYLLNRAFRRNQCEFNTVMDNCVHDPAGQRELQTSWTLRD